MLDRLEDFVESGMRVPLLGKFVLDEAQFFELCNKLRTSLDPAIKQAELTNREVERIVKESEFRAKQVMDRAQEDAKTLTQENVILKAARDEAERILTETKRQANEMQAQAYQYAFKVMSELDRHLSATLGNVKAGEDELKKFVDSTPEKK